MQRLEVISKFLLALAASVFLFMSGIGLPPLGVVLLPFVAQPVLMFGYKYGIAGGLAVEELTGRYEKDPGYYADYAKRLNAVDAAAVQRVAKRLLDPAKIGLGMLAYVSVKLEKKGRMPVEQFTRSVHGWSEVVACYSMTGDMDYLMRVQVEDLDHYSRFIMDKLLKQPGVIDIKSNFVLERVKETTALPLEQLA